MTDNWIYFVPDPLKFLTKLGSRDMANYNHVEEYRVSCMDMMKPLFNEIIADRLSVGVYERYKGEINDCKKLIGILFTLCMIVINSRGCSFMIQELNCVWIQHIVS